MKCRTCKGTGRRGRHVWGHKIPGLESRGPLGSRIFGKPGWIRHEADHGLDIGAQRWYRVCRACKGEEVKA